MMSSVRPENDRAVLETFFAAVQSVVFGQQPLIERVLLAVLADGHVLLEGVPGLAKTLLVRTVAAALGLPFQRVQFTPDLLPADLIGTQIYQPATGAFQTRLGPIFANVVLADEINRAPAKVQAALLEAMEERQVTIAETTHRLPLPFLVMATQNPLDQEGTYALPEAQTDRFLMKLLVDYPSYSDERAMLDGPSTAATTVSAVLDAATLAKLKQACDGLHVDDKIKDYVLAIVRSTREPPGELAALIEHGASPRASLALLKLAKAKAFLAGRAYVVPDDVKSLAADVLRHRLRTSYEADAAGLNADALIHKLLQAIPVP
jgi:MoxR-like ATPase